MDTATQNRQTFKEWRAWLKTQSRRQDPVGDFARGYLRDTCGSRLRTLSGLDHHLKTEHCATWSVLDARDRAWREWQSARQQAASADRAPMGAGAEYREARVAAGLVD